MLKQMIIDRQTLKTLKMRQIVKKNHVLHQQYQQPDLRKDLFQLKESQEFQMTMKC